MTDGPGGGKAKEKISQTEFVEYKRNFAEVTSMRKTITPKQLRMAGYN